MDLKPHLVTPGYPATLFVPTVCTLGVRVTDQVRSEAFPVVHRAVPLVICQLLWFGSMLGSDRRLQMNGSDLAASTAKGNV